MGLCGGGVYVGCFYFVLNDITIPPQYKELVLNIATLFNDMGVLLSSILCVIFDNTFLKNKNNWNSKSYRIIYLFLWKNYLILQ